MKTSTKENIVILLTATVCCKDVIYCQLNDPKLRSSQYVKSICHYLINTDKKICFVENSGYDIRDELDKYLSDKFNKSFSDYKYRLEFLFTNNKSDSLEKGKGYGEAKIIEYALNNSTFIDERSYILKISGRVIIKNIDKIINELSSNNKLHTFRGIYSFGGRLLTMIFFTDYTTMKYSLPYLLNSCDDRSLMLFEDVLNVSVLKNYQVHIRPIKTVLDIDNYQKATLVHYKNLSWMNTKIFNLTASIHVRFIRRKTALWTFLYRVFTKLSYKYYLTTRNDIN